MRIGTTTRAGKNLSFYRNFLKVFNLKNLGLLKRLRTTTVINIHCPVSTSSHSVITHNLDMCRPIFEKMVRHAIPEICRKSVYV